MPGKFSAPSPASLRALNAAASVLVIFVACAAYGALPVHAEQLARLYAVAGHSFTGAEFMWAAAGVYAAAVTAWMGLDRHPGVSKSLRALGVLLRLLRAPAATLKQGLDNTERVAVLATLLKAFFGPLMVMSLMTFCMAAWANAQSLSLAVLVGGDPRTVFDRFGFWFLLQLILFVDVLIFTVGYLIESPRLGNEIRSVDSTLVGWAAALVCYPPFNIVTGQILGANVSDFPQFEHPAIHVTLNALLLLLMAVYASASVALGFKGSNLTHRGIVSRWPYSVIRHPAYVCKNMAWWIGSAPLVSAAFALGWASGLMALASVAGWTLLYVLRALTEEDHLRRVDGGYAEYASRVRYRFVPGVW